MERELANSKTNQNYNRFETIYGPCSETLETSNQARKVREGEKTVEESQASEPRNASPALTKGF